MPLKMIFIIKCILFSHSIYGEPPDLVQERGTQSRRNIEKMVRGNPQVGWKKLVEFANKEIQSSLYTKFLVKPGHPLALDSKKLTACQHIEILLPVKSISPTGFTVMDERKDYPMTWVNQDVRFPMLRWEDKDYFMYGKDPPFKIDVTKKSIYFVFSLDFTPKVNKSLSWWNEIIQIEPELRKSAHPFLLLESTGKDLTVTDSFEDYKIQKHHEVRPTREELRERPFSRTYLYYAAAKPVRVQLPEPCL